MRQIIFDHAAVDAALEQMADAMFADEIHLIGIHRGGAIVADKLQQRLEARGAKLFRGNLDISLYRDDLDRIGLNPVVNPSQLPHDFSGRHIWLVDDVLFTGRTIRAALGEIFDFGRPAAVKLAVLVDRGGHQLPIAADLVGLHYATDSLCSIKLNSDADWHIEQRELKKEEVAS
ncbi:MAG: bifunctional pyr operon transcriptional regulator/uracil phosphoribosyltransferase PyrR [Mariprofundus sp.]|nr:bifunctional pyr operon transcriptional regulator/uracil phosphoribosyltransferase PyrR [Mariprofundus sp.]